jgi:hypothetical protein
MGFTKGTDHKSICRLYSVTALKASLVIAPVDKIAERAFSAFSN